MKTLLIATLFLAPVAAFADGDAAKGEAEFKACRACHTIASPDEVLVRGGKTGPNLYHVIGRTAGTEEGFKYGKDMIAAGEAGLVWTEDNIAHYVLNPRKFLGEQLDKPSAKTSMPMQRVKEPDDLAAYLASFGTAE